MSITIRDNLLLPGVAPSQVKTAGGSPSNRHTDGIFAGQLDRALEADGHADVPSPAKAQALADTLSLQMLHATLSLAGESSGELNTPATPFDLTAQHLKTLVSAYAANQPEDTRHTSRAADAPSQLREMAVEPAASGKQQVGTEPAGHGLDAIIARASSRYGVDAGLIKAVIKAESNFNPNAVSHAGAQGLMQLMPGTARSLGVTDSFDPEQNIMAGTRFLSDLLKRYNGDLDSALAAYNWGPGNVDRKPDRLPRETRDYLARVRTIYNSYSA